MAITSTPFNASSIYGAMSKLANRGGEGQSGSASEALSGTNFSDFLKDQVKSVVDQGNATEGKQRDLLAGKADLVDVVTAVSETEVAMETMVSVRDRVISAYEEIMRMPI